MAADQNAVREITGGMRAKLRPPADGPAGVYQAWPVPQCGHATEVETAAWKM
jgi:hypothetical protein